MKDQLRQQELERQQVLCARVFNRIVNRGKVVAFEAWRDHMRTSRLLERIGARFRNQGMARSMSQWQHFVMTRKHQRDLVRRVMGRFENKRLYAGFRAWMSFSTEQKYSSELENLRAYCLQKEREQHLVLCKRVFNRILHRNFAAAFDTWQTCTRESRLLERIVARFRNQGMARSMSQWQSFTTKRKKERNTVWRVTNRLFARKKQIMFYAWSSFVSQRREDRALMNRMMSKIFHRELYGAWKQWQATIRKSQLNDMNICRIEKSGERMTFFHRRLLKSKIFYSWRALNSAENGHRLIQSANILRNALLNCQQELKIMKKHYHTHLQFEVEGLVRYVEQAEKEDRQKSVHHRQVNHMLHSRKMHLNDSSKSSSSKKSHSWVGLEDVAVDDGKERKNLHQRLVKANRGKPIPWVGSSSVQSSHHAIGKVQLQLAKSFERQSPIVEKFVTPRKKKPPVPSVSGTILTPKSARSKKKQFALSEHVHPWDGGTHDYLHEHDIQHNDKKALHAKKTHMKGKLVKRKAKLLASQQKRSTTAGAVSVGAQSDRSNTGRKAQIVSHLQELKISANANLQRAMEDYDHAEKGSSDPVPGIQQEISRLMKLLVDFQSKTAEDSLAISVLDKKTSVDLLLESQQISEEHMTRENKKHFDDLLVDYANRVHDYRDPSLTEIIYPRPLLPVHRELLDTPRNKDF